MSTSDDATPDLHPPVDLSRSLYVGLTLPQRSVLRVAIRRLLEQGFALTPAQRGELFGLLQTLMPEQVNSQLAHQLVIPGDDPGSWIVLSAPNDAAYEALVRSLARSIDAAQRQLEAPALRVASEGGDHER